MVYVDEEATAAKPILQIVVIYSNTNTCYMKITRLVSRKFGFAVVFFYKERKESEVIPIQSSDEFRLLTKEKDI